MLTLDRLDRPVDTGYDHVFGPPGAEVMLVEYGSYACPHCRAANERIAAPNCWGDGESVYSGYPPRDFWASAVLLSTVRDMAKYDLAVDRHELLKAETLARAWTPLLSKAGQPLAQGLGWYVTDYRGTRLVWRYGHWGTGAEDASRKTQAAPASPDGIPTTGPARDCERSSGTALAKWIADCRAKVRKAIPLDPTLAAA